MDPISRWTVDQDIHHSIRCRKVNSTFTAAVYSVGLKTSLPLKLVTLRGMLVGRWKMEYLCVLGKGRIVPISLSHCQFFWSLRLRKTWKLTSKSKDLPPWEFPPTLTPSTITRECHGFSNPHGSQVGVVTGAGAGWKFTPLKNPHPCHGFEGF